MEMIKQIHDFPQEECTILFVSAREINLFKIWENNLRMFALLYIQLISTVAVLTQIIYRGRCLSCQFHMWMGCIWLVYTYI